VIEPLRSFFSVMPASWQEKSKRAGVTSPFVLYDFKSS
jgi:hypothetical protein